VCTHIGHTSTPQSKAEGKKGTTTQPQEKKDKKIRGLILPLRIAAKKKIQGKYDGVENKLGYPTPTQTLLQLNCMMNQAQGKKKQQSQQKDAYPPILGRARTRKEGRSMYHPCRYQKRRTKEKALLVNPPKNISLSFYILILL